METEEFEKTIKQEELFKSDNREKIMLKSYLDILLRGGKKREQCYLYAVAIVDGSNARCQHADTALPTQSVRELLNTEITKKRKELISLFEKIKLEKKWTVVDERQVDYDENRKEIYWDEMVPNDTPEPIVSETIITKKITTYYIDESLDIKAV